MSWPPCCSRPPLQSNCSEARASLPPLLGPRARALLRRWVPGTGAQGAAPRPPPLPLWLLAQCWLWHWLCAGGSRGHRAAVVMTLLLLLTKVVAVVYSPEPVASPPAPLPPALSRGLAPGAATACRPARALPPHVLRPARSALRALRPPTAAAGAPTARGRGREVTGGEMKQPHLNPLYHPSVNYR